MSHDQRLVGLHALGEDILGLAGFSEHQFAQGEIAQYLLVAGHSPVGPLKKIFGFREVFLEQERQSKKIA